MFLNNILLITQNFFEKYYAKSLVLNNLDCLIYINILLVYVFSVFSNSDNIGYFALISAMLTGVKFLVKKGEYFSLSLGDVFLLFYFIFVVISVAGSSLFYLSLKGFCKTLTYLAFYISLVHYLKDNKGKIKYILLLLSGVCFIESLIAIHQNFLSVSEISGWQDVSKLNPEDIMTRVYGSLKPYNPNLFGGYMLAILPATIISFILPLKTKHYKTAFVGFCFFILGIITIFLTGCRGAYIGLFFELVVLAVLTYKFLKPVYKKVFLYITGILVAISSFVIVSMSALRTRIFSIFSMRNDSSNSFRFNVYHSCINMFKDNWILGIGVGNQNFREIYGLYMKTGFDALSAYNIYLETAVESGILALFAFLGFVGLNLYCAFKYVFCKRSLNVFYLIIAISSLIGLLLHGMVDTVFYRPQLQFVFWTMIAIIRVIATKPRIV